MIACDTSGVAARVSPASGSEVRPTLTVWSNVPPVVSANENFGAAVVPDATVPLPLLIENGAAVPVTA